MSFVLIYLKTNVFTPEVVPGPGTGSLHNGQWLTSGVTLFLQAGLLSALGLGAPPLRAAST